MLVTPLIQSRATRPTFTFALLLCLLLAATTQAQMPVPPLKARVIDLTGTLDAGQTAALEGRLQGFEEKEGSQIAVLLVPTTQPEAIEQYSIRVVEKWRLGRENVDDGALLLVAKRDQTMRIEVGYGLEGALTDATSKRIIAEIITPYFKNGDFFGGIQAGARAIMTVIRGEPLPPPTLESSEQDDDSENLLPGFLFFAFVIALMFFAMSRSGGRAYRGRGLGRSGYYVGGASLPMSGGFSGGGSFGGGGGFSGGGGGFGGGGASGSW